MTDRKVCPWCREGHYTDHTLCPPCRGTDRYINRYINRGDTPTEPVDTDI